ncbi:MAG: FixH family protein [Arenicellales bacterium]|jgi:hypothetical protein|nr:hypothetical protein [Chloroflexota bacterium]MDP6950117.1 FixH family protein [Arenicellales bacterium]|tara:strand:- start:1777 stop:2304 length:528 start_codon:yes stop_codon:yes gene_type:complete
MTMTKAGGVTPIPWYRVPFVWLLIGVPASSVILGIIMITLAIRTDDGLVIDDYYQHGKEINQVLARDQTARKRNAQARLVFDTHTGVLSADLAGDNMGQVHTLACDLMHPTRSGFDQQLTLQRGPDGRLHGDFAPLNQQRWIVQVSTQDWRLVGNLNLSHSDTLELSPQAVPPDS